MDEDMQNLMWAESARENFYEAVSQRNWSLARAVLKDIEEKNISTWKLRLDMNKAMAEDEAETEDVRDAVRESDRENEERETAHESNLSSQQDSYGGY